jgi:hypothetical protein
MAAIYYPPAFINAYLREKITDYFKDNPLDGIIGDTTIPFFPTSPTDITALTERFEANDKFAVYDRMLKMRKSPFPHIKSEQLMYYFYATGENPIPFIIEVTQQIQDWLDREDESAQELNDWIKITQNGDNPKTSPLKNDQNVTLPCPFFHRLRIYQLQETRDIIDFGTARTYAGNKIIIDYDWHKS